MFRTAGISSGQLYVVLRHRDTIVLTGFSTRSGLLFNTASMLYMTGDIIILNMVLSRSPSGTPRPTLLESKYLSCMLI